MADVSRAEFVHHPTKALSDSLRVMNRNLEKQEAAVRDARVAQVINKELHIGPESVNVTFDIDSHVITDQTYKDIQERQVKIVFGEFDAIRLMAEPQYTAEDIAQSNEPTMLDPGIGSSREARRKNTAYMKQLVADGVSLIGTDGNHNAFYRGKKIPGGAAALVYLGTIVGGMAYGGKELTHVLKGESPVTRRNFLKLSVAAGASLLSLGSIADNIMSGHLGNPSIRQIGGPGKVVPGLQVALENILTKSEYVSFSQGLIEIRNLVMAENGWNVIARAAQKNTDRPLNMLCMVASGHFDVYNQFIEGPKTLHDKLKHWTDRLTNQTFDLLFSEKSGLSEKDALEIFISYGKIFSDPVELGVFPLRAAGAGDPPSAQDILLESIQERIDRSPPGVHGVHSDRDWLRSAMKRIVDAHEGDAIVVGQTTKWILNQSLGN